MTTNVQTNPDNKPVRKIDLLKNMLNAQSVTDQFKNALKDNSGPFVASLIDLYSGDAYLQNCDPKEVIMEALKAAVLKLPINKSLGFAWIVPYNNSVKTDTGWVKKPTPSFQIGYKGYIQLAMRTGQYKFINADIIYEGELVNTVKLTGEYDLSGKRTSDKVTGYFAHIELINGFSKTIYTTVEKMAKHAKTYSQSIKFDKNVTIETLIASAGKSNEGSVVGWKGNFDSMALKTVLANVLSHYGYLSIDMIGAFDADRSDSHENNYKDEVNANANAQTVDFEETTAEVVDEETGEVVNENPTPKPAF